MDVRRLPALALAVWLFPGLANAQTELFNGFPETVSGAQDSIQAFYLDVPAGLTSLEFITTGGTGDPDIYVNFGEPYLTTADPTPECESFNDGPEEYCEIVNPKAGLWYVEVYGFAAYTNTNLLGIAARGLTSGAAVTIAGATGSASWFYLEVPGGQSKLTVGTSGGTGDPDLFVGDDLFGDPDCGSVEVGTVDSCVVNSPAAGRWYVLIYGFEAYSGVALLARTSAGGGGGGGAVAPGALGGLLLAGLAALARRRFRGRPAPTP